MSRPLNRSQRKFRKYFNTSGFWPRVRTRTLHAPVLFGLINMPNGALRPPPPAHRSFAASYLPPKTFPQARTRAARGVYLFIGLSCTLLSYIASYWATLHPPELRCTLRATLHPIELCCTSKTCCIQLSYAAPLSKLCCTSELSCILQSYVAPFCDRLRPIWAKMRPKIYAARSELS